MSSFNRRDLLEGLAAAGPAATTTADACAGMPPMLRCLRQANGKEQLKLLRDKAKRLNNAGTSSNS